MPSRAITAVRRFNRFYTRQIGVLHEYLLSSPYSLTEMRVLYELSHRDGPPTSSELCEFLGLDAGYFSRILAHFQKLGFVRRARSREDARASLIEITAKGRAAFAPYDVRQDREVASMLAPLKPSDVREITGAMSTIQNRLDRQPQDQRIALRPPRPGDMGWVVQRHGEIYAEEYGWNWEFEGLVAGVVSEFVKNFDPKRERCWIAELNGRRVGSVFCFKKAESVAKLRMLFVDKDARGLGLGSRLVRECIAFARKKGYQKMTLWTESPLKAARRIYAAAGFRIVSRDPVHNFGKRMISEIWELELRK